MTRGDLNNNYQVQTNLETMQKLLETIRAAPSVSQAAKDSCERMVKRANVEAEGVQREVLRLKALI